MTNITPEQKLRINASPTKEFFIYMLTRDVPLSRAILDLVDNSIDGARKLRPNHQYDNLWIRIEFDGNSFRICDNCGGIDIKTASEYAFRFGRSPKAVETEGSIGQFGVGMKRSFFKMGRYFSVNSTTAESNLLINVDVDKWISEVTELDSATWHFDFDKLMEAPMDPKAIGTTIEVSRLLVGAKQQFLLKTFEDQLIREIGAAYALTMDRGLVITLNGFQVDYQPQKLLYSEAIVPAYYNKEYKSTKPESPDGNGVRVKLYAGISEQTLKDGGWYIYCNGRLILNADKSEKTIWGARNKMPQYHPNYARFRGFAYFEAEHSSLLPWTTTKTGVDADSELYQAVQQEMIELSKPVLEFLKRLENERKARDMGELSTTPLADSISATMECRSESLAREGLFISPPYTLTARGPKMTRIQYNKPMDEVNRAKDLLGVTTNIAVGELTFDYYLKNEE